MRRVIAIGAACLGIGSLGIGFLVNAHTFYTTKITWSRDVSRVMYRHCASCHHQGGTAFSLMTYAEARPLAEAIKVQVLHRSMPPWNAVEGFGEFKHDAALTQEDLEIIGEWVDGGAPEGNPAYLPPAPPFSADPDERPEGDRRFEVLGAKVMKHEAEIIGITPNQLPLNGAIQVVAHLSGGAIEPLIWIEDFNPKFKTTYYFSEPLHLPRGTKIEVTPRTGSVTLIVK